MQKLSEQVSMLALYANTPINLGLGLGLSDAQAFFESKSYSEFGKQQEARSKIVSSLFDRLNTVVKAINALGGRRR